MSDAKALAKFAKASGVKIVTCDKTQWGGSIAYTEKDYPWSKISGFKSESAAYKHWVESTFGRHAGRAVLKLLRASTRRADTGQS